MHLEVSSLQKRVNELSFGDLKKKKKNARDIIQSVI